MTTTSKPSVVIYGPKGCGKTTNAEALAKHYGLERIIEEAGIANLSIGDRSGALILTTDGNWATFFAQELFHIGIRAIPFHVAMRAAGLSNEYVERLRIVGAARIHAHDILGNAQQHMLDRAAARDQPEGERSMGRAVRAFNAITGQQLSERDGWMFMAVLKAARACNTPTGQPDDYEDGAAYFALAGEAASTQENGDVR